MRADHFIRWFIFFGLIGILLVKAFFGLIGLIADIPTNLAEQARRKKAYEYVEPIAGSIADMDVLSKEREPVLGGPFAVWLTGDDFRKTPGYAAYTGSRGKVLYTEEFAEQRDGVSFEYVVHIDLNKAGKASANFEVYSKPVAGVLHKTDRKKGVSYLEYGANVSIIDVKAENIVYQKMFTPGLYQEPQLFEVLDAFPKRYISEWEDPRGVGFRVILGIKRWINTLVPEQYRGPESMPVQASDAPSGMNTFVVFCAFGLAGALLIAKAMKAGGQKHGLDGESS